MSGGDRVNCFAVNEMYGTVLPHNLIEVSDDNNGYYSVILKPNQSGFFAVHVLINGQEIGGSPFILQVTPGPPHSNHSYLTY